MNFFSNLLENKTLIIASVAWLSAGVIKMFIDLYVNKKLSIKRIIGAGGMPSSHTSTVVALVIAIGHYDSVKSITFAIAVFFAIIVIHDAVGVRLETGKQAKVLNTMMFESEAFRDLDFEKQLKEYIGHTPLQALIGAFVGIGVAIIMIGILK